MCELTSKEVAADLPHKKIAVRQFVTRTYEEGIIINI